MLTFLLLRRRFATAAIDAVAKKVGRPKAENKQSSKKTATTRKTAEPKFDLARITKASLNAVLSNPELDEAKERLTKMQLEAKQKKTEIQIAAKERLAQMQMEAMEKKAQMRIKSTDKSELLRRKISEAEATTGVETETETATKTGTKTETDANVKSKISKSEPFQSTRKTLKPVVFRKKTTLELFNEKKKLEAKAAKANDPELLEAIAEAETYALTVENIRFDFYRHFDDEVYEKLLEHVEAKKLPKSTLCCISNPGISKLPEILIEHGYKKLLILDASETFTTIWKRKMPKISVEKFSFNKILNLHYKDIHENRDRFSPIFEKNVQRRNFDEFFEENFDEKKNSEICNPPMAFFAVRANMKEMAFLKYLLHQVTLRDSVFRYGPVEFWLFNSWLTTSILLNKNHKWHRGRLLHQLFHYFFDVEFLPIFFDGPESQKIDENFNGNLKGDQSFSISSPLDGEKFDGAGIGGVSIDRLIPKTRVSKVARTEALLEQSRRTLGIKNDERYLFRIRPKLKVALPDHLLPFFPTFYEILTNNHPSVDGHGQNLILIMERLLPNCGFSLLEMGFDMFTSTANMTVQQMADLLNSVSGWPEFQGSALKSELQIGVERILSGNFSLQK